MQGNGLLARIGDLVDRRVALETRLQNEKGELSGAVSRSYDNEYTLLQRQLATLFREAQDDSQRITIMLEMMRILENRLVYLQNFDIDPTADNRMLAQLVTRFIDQLGRERSSVLTTLEMTYYRAVAALYAGDLDRAADAFRAACESEESDETNDIKYKSYVILGHLSHQQRDYTNARDLHNKSLRYSANDNVTAQALALKALNAYALQEFDEALAAFREALSLFDSDKPFFNSYFYRNALLFCASIHHDRKEYDEALVAYERVIDEVEQSSYDYFDALSQTGKIHYVRGRFQDAANFLERAIASHKFSENEHLVDTRFWLAKAYLRLGNNSDARRCLEQIASSEVKYEKKPQAVELLQRVS